MPKLWRRTSCHQYRMPSIHYWEKSSRNPSRDSLHIPCSQGASWADCFSRTGSKFIWPSLRQQSCRPGQSLSSPQWWKCQIEGSYHYTLPGQCFPKANIRWVRGDTKDIRTVHGGWCPPGHPFNRCSKHHTCGKCPQHHSCGRGPQTACLEGPHGLTDRVGRHSWPKC